jgi:hypothetical protein
MTHPEQSSFLTSFWVKEAAEKLGLVTALQ